MKKIVALVLSLVMVLGLATTAMAVVPAAPSAAKDVGDYYVMSTGVTDGTVANTTFAVDYYKAVAPVYNALGEVATGGRIAYYGINGIDGAFVEVSSVGLADYVLFVGRNATTGAGETLFKYMAKVETNVAYLGNGAAFNDFGFACGQYKDANYDATATYYTFEDDVYVATKGGSMALMVGGKVVDVEPTSGAWVGHTAAYTYDKDFKVTAVTCSKCGCAAVIVPNYASLPVAALAAGIVGGPINTSEYYYWTETVAAPEAPETDKVESAETFDAGIAMYVGMSVMAAAGSAVVLKKKD